MVCPAGTCQIKVCHTKVCGEGALDEPAQLIALQGAAHNVFASTPALTGRESLHP